MNIVEPRSKDATKCRTPHQPLEGQNTRGNVEIRFFSPVIFEWKPCLGFTGLFHEPEAVRHRPLHRSSDLVTHSIKRAVGSHRENSTQLNTFFANLNGFHFATDTVVGF